MPESRPPAPVARPSVPSRRGPKALVGQTILKLGRPVGRFVRRSMLGAEVRDAFDPPIDEVEAPYPIIFYFAEPALRIYQIRQWLPVIERVRQQFAVAIVTRTVGSTRVLREMSETPVHYARTLDALIQTYTTLDPKVIIYCNNGMRNFQSLIYRRALHVHVNHGESDKLVMASNQAKAYDRVVVAGPAAIDRYRDNLLDFDAARFVQVGRPQLDIETPCDVPAAAAGVRTVLYAPTWHGEDAGNDYSSVDVYGPAIVSAALALPRTRVLYKPHPRTLTATAPRVVQAHQAILGMLRDANERAGTEIHLTPFESDILGVFRAVDLLVTDVSSVGLDFLYLRPDAPIVLTDRLTNRAALRRLSPLASAVEVIDRETVAGVEPLLLAGIESDPLRESRLAMSRHYFGFSRGQSTEQFLSFLVSTMERRDELLGQMNRASERSVGRSVTWGNAEM